MAINTTQRTTSVVFIDGSFADFQATLSGLAPSVTAIVLDPAQDGIGQMADALAGVSGLDSIHIISHGASGQINLGAAQLSQDTPSRNTRPSWHSVKGFAAQTPSPSRGGLGWGWGLGGYTIQPTPIEPIPLPTSP